MDDTQMLDCTQALPDDVWGDLESSKPKLVAVLEVGETTYDVFEGETKIGRDPTTCSIVISKPVLSKEHAVLEVEGDSHMIADLGSRNKTRIGKLVLKPHVRYALRGGEELRFGDVCSKYFLKSSGEEESDTCSESMLDATDPVSPKLGSLQVPETPEESKVKTSDGLKVMNNHVIPESPSASQSTPLPSKGQPGIDNKKPPDISAIKLPDLSAIEEDEDDDDDYDDSFFFVSTQPKKSPNMKANVNTNIGRNNKENVQRDEDIDSDASTDVELENEKVQNIKSIQKSNLIVEKTAQSSKEGSEPTVTPKEKENLNQDKGSSDKQINAKLPVNSAKDKEDQWEEGYNSEASTDIEEDSDVISENKNEKQICNDEQENNNSTRKDKNVKCDMKSKAPPEDIFNQPTQEFPLELEEGTQIAEAFGLLDKATPNDASYALGDNTQDILEAFSCSSSKTSPKGKREVGKDIFDLPTQTFCGNEDANQVTQPYLNEEKTFLASGQVAEDDDYVPTQLFLDDSDSKVFKMPYSVSPARVTSPKRNQEVKDDNGQSSYKQGLSEFDEEIFNQPTQKYDDTGALAEEATQLFEDPCLTEKTSCDQASIEASAEKIPQGSKELCHTEKTSLDQAGENGVSLGKATTIDYHEDSDTDIEDDDLAPTQKFSPKPKTKPLDTEALPRLKKGDSNKNTSGDDVDNDDLPPTQVFPTKPVIGQKASPRPSQLVFTPPKKIPATSAFKVAEEKSDEQNPDDCAPTQVYLAKCKINNEVKLVEEDEDDFAPTQVFTAKGTTSIPGDQSVEEDQDDLAPTQAFSATTKGTTSVVKEKLDKHEDDLMPTQVFPLKPQTRDMKDNLPKDDQDDLMPTQVFSLKPQTTVVEEKLHEDDEDDLMPTQVFPLKPENKSMKEKLHEDDQGEMMPTQVFSPKAQTKEKVNKTSEYSDSDTDIDDDTDTKPLQRSPKSCAVKQGKEGSSKQEWQLVVTDEGESFCNPSENSDGELAATQELDTTNVKKFKISDKPLRNQEKEYKNEEEDLPPTQMFQREDLKSTPEKSKSECSKRDRSSTDISLTLLPDKICKNYSTFATPEKPAASQVNTAKKNKSLLQMSDTKEVAYKASIGSDDDDSDLAPTQVFTVPGKQVIEEEQENMDDCDATQELIIDTPISLDEALVRASSTVEKQREGVADIMRGGQEAPVEEDVCSDTSETLLQNELDIDPSVPEITSRNITGEENLVQESGMSQQDTMILTPSCEDEGKGIESTKHFGDPCGSVSTTNLSKPDFDTTSAGFIICGTKAREDVMETYPKGDSADKKGNSSSEIADQNSKELMDESKNSKFFIVTKGSSFSNNKTSTPDKTRVQAEDSFRIEEEEEELDDSLNFSHNLRLVCGIDSESSESENDEPVEPSQILFEMPEEIPPSDEVHDSERNNDNAPETSKDVSRRGKQDVSTDGAQTSSENKSMKTGKGKDRDSKSKSRKDVQDSSESHKHKESDSENKIKESPEDSDSKKKSRKSREPDSKNKNRKSFDSDSKKKDRKSLKSDTENKRSKSPESDIENKDEKLPAKSISHKKDEISREESNSENKRGHEESKNKSRKSHEESESRNKNRRSHRVSDAKNKSRKLHEESDSSKNKKSSKESDSSKSRNSREKSDSVNKSRSQEVSDSKSRSRRSHNESDSKNSSTKLPEKLDAKNKDKKSNRAEPSSKQSSDDELEDKSSCKARKRTQDIKSKIRTDGGPEKEQKMDEETEKAEGFGGFQQSPNMKRMQVLEKLKENVTAEEESSAAEGQPQHEKKMQSKDQVAPKTVEIPSSPGSSRKGRKRAQPADETDSSEIVQSSNELSIGQRTTRKSVAGDKDDNPKTKKGRRKHENVRECNSNKKEDECKGNKKEDECNSSNKEDDSTEEDVSEKPSGTFARPPRPHRSKRRKDYLSMAKGTSTDNEAEICTAKSGSQGSSQTNIENEPLNNTQQSDIPRNRNKRSSRRFSSDENAEMKTSTVKTKDSEVCHEENTNTVETSRSRRSRAAIKHDSDADSGEIDQNEISRESKAEKRKSRGISEKEKNVIKQEHTEEVQSTTSQKSQESSATEVKRRRTTRIELHVIKEDSTQETSQVKSTEECSQPKQRGRRAGRSSTADSSQGEEEEEAKTPRGRADKLPRMSVIYEPPSTPKSSRKRSSSQSSTGSDMSTESKKKHRGEEESSVTKTSRSSRSSQRSGKESPAHHKDMILWSPGQRQYQASTKPRVMFTGYTDQADEKIVVELGGTLVDTAQECTVLVTTNIRRTCKFLSIMGKGQPIVSPKWLAASKLAKSFVDPWKYLVKDVESEKKFTFKLEASLKQAKIRKVFDGISIHATSKVKPPPDQMKEIVECAGGEYLDNLPKIASNNIFLVSCADDKRVFTKMKREGFQVVGTEFILTGLLQQKLLTDLYNL